jgi:hypothetical protein
VGEAVERKLQSAAPQDVADLLPHLQTHASIVTAAAKEIPSYESRPGYHPVEVHTQAGPTQASLHNQAVEALDTDRTSGIAPHPALPIGLFDQLGDF